jgi:hypothetical protein
MWAASRLLLLVLDTPLVDMLSDEDELEGDELDDEL